MLKNSVKMCHLLLNDGGEWWILIIFPLKCTMISLVLNESLYSFTLVLPASCWRYCCLFHMYVGTVWTGRHWCHISWTIWALQCPLCVTWNKTRYKTNERFLPKKLFSKSAWQQTHRRDSLTYMCYRKILKNICSLRSFFVLS